VIDHRAWRICDMPERLRPREEMKRLGVANVSDDVLLAIVLRAGTRGKNVADLAREMLVQHGSLTQLASSSVDDLRKAKAEIEEDIRQASGQTGSRVRFAQHQRGDGPTGPTLDDRW